MRVPEFTQSEELALTTFMALLQATSLPGSSHALAVADYPENFVAIADALIDLETTFYSPDPEITQYLGRTGARSVDVENAAYQIWPTLKAQDMELIRKAPIGTMVYPDSSASIYIGCELGIGLALQLSGPGIEGTLELKVTGIPESFWKLRNEYAVYPLGWDVFLVHGDKVTAIPRSTEVKITTQNH